RAVRQADPGTARHRPGQGHAGPRTRARPPRGQRPAGRTGPPGRHRPARRRGPRADDVERRGGVAVLRGAGHRGRSGPEGAVTAPAPTVARGWLADLEAAWRRGDPAAIGTLFTADAAYHQGPFASPHRGPAEVCAHWTMTLARQAEPRIWFGEPIEAGDR